MNRSLLAAPLVVVALAGAYLIGGGSGPRVATAQTTDPAPRQGVVVDGLGKVSGTPDVLRAILGVSVHGKDVSGTLGRASELQAAVAASLKRNGVAAVDLQTSDVQINQDYTNKGVPNGYRVTETLTAKLRNLKRAGRALSDAVAAGGDQAVLQGVSFALEDNAALLAKARDGAFADAKAKAEQYAALAGRSLGDVVLVSETASPAAPMPYAADRLAFASAGPAVPVEAGSQDVSVSVTVRWTFR